MKKSRQTTSNLKEFLKQKRTDAGLTQAEVATRLGYSSSQFISNWERGLASPPVATLRELTKMYKVPADTMFDLLLAEVKTNLHKEFYSSRRRS